MEPHLSDSRDCRARPHKFGSVDKEQLEAISQVEHGRFTEAARAENAAKRVEKAIIAFNKDVSMAEGLDFGVLESEAEV